MTGAVGVGGVGFLAGGRKTDFRPLKVDSSLLSLRHMKMERFMVLTHIVGIRLRLCWSLRRKIPETRASLTTISQDSSRKQVAHSTQGHLRGFNTEAIYKGVGKMY